MSEFFLTHETLIAIAMAALVTYSLRVGGLLLAGRLPSSGRFKRFMDALPGTILVSLIAPGVIASGLWGAIAAGATAFITFRTKNVFAAMIAGVLIVAIARRLG